MLTYILAFVAFATLAFAQPNPGKVTGDISVHDPTMCRDSSGTYFIFGACLVLCSATYTSPQFLCLATGTGIPIHTSMDRINWTLVGSVWPDGAPSDTNQFTGTTNGYAGSKSLTVDDYSASLIGIFGHRTAPTWTANFM